MREFSGSQAEPRQAIGAAEWRKGRPPAPRGLGASGTTPHHGKSHVAYGVLADLVLAGWRPSAERIPESRPTALDDRTEFDIPTAFELRNDLRTIGETNKSGRYNLDGFVIYGGQGSTPSEYESYIQVFRNGAIEAVNSSILGGHPSKLIPSTYYEQEIEASLASIQGFLRKLNIEPPFPLLLSLIGVKGLTMALDPRWMAYRPHTIDRDLRLLPEAIIEEYDKTAQENLAPLFLMIWQAAGFDRNYNYDQQGQRLK